MTEKDSVTKYDPDWLTVVVGDHKKYEKDPEEVDHEVDYIITHPQYNPGSELLLDGSVIKSKYLLANSHKKTIFSLHKIDIRKIFEFLFVEC